MENIHTIKESLIYSTLYIHTVPQNIYQHKSFSFWSPDFEVNSKWMTERSGSVIECLTRDQRAVGLSLTSVTALWSLSKTHLS